MNLSQLLWSLEDYDLRVVVLSYGRKIHNYNDNRFIMKDVPEELRDFREALDNRSKEQYLECILGRIGQINNAQAQLYLERLEFAGLSIPSHQDNKNAFVISLLPEGLLLKTVERVRSNLNSLLESENNKLREEALENDTPLPSPKQIPPFNGTIHQRIEWLVAAISDSAPHPTKSAFNPMSLFCPHCKHDNPDEASHCISCGRELPLSICPKCDTTNPPQAKFCMGCGEER